MRKRTQAREITLQALYQFDIQRQIDESVLGGVDDFEGFIVKSTDDPEVREYARGLLDGIFGSLRELDEQYSSAKIALVPSFFEGFGFPASEAMAAGLAVVALIAQHSSCKALPSTCWSLRSPDSSRRSMISPSRLMAIALPR